MTKFNQIYKCDICSNVIEVVHDGAGELVCCGQAMELLKEKTKTEEGNEKHVPVIEKSSDGLKAKVGSTSHPMEDKHYIEWIEINMLDKGRIAKRFLKPGDKPEVDFCTREDNIEVRAYCNIHGLWKL